MNAEQMMGQAPETLEEAITRGLKLVEENAANVFDLDEENFIGELHHGFGRMMRNHWGLWKQDSGLYQEINKQFKLEHADDVSGIVLYAIYRTKKGLPLDLEPIARRFHLHWKQWADSTVTIIE